ncbi:MAG: copper-binding protein [Chloroflexi bacterium]|nr:copper-binding protein [Chloroflexota bacterium]
MQWQKVLPLLGFGLALALVGCREVRIASAEAEAADPGAVQIALSEWAVAPSVATVSAGAVTIQATNQGQLEHELVLLRTDLAPDALPLQADGTRVDEDAAGEGVGEIEDLEAGTTGADTFDLAPGTYVLICNVPGHYQAGMVATLQVE